jgi:tetratricopeptide (TPR) repeat protein
MNQGESSFARHACAAVLCAAALAVTPNASAQSAADPRAALALLRQADAAFEVSDFESALRLYQQAYQSRQDATILNNVARMQARLGRWRDAADTWRRYLERVPDAPNRAETEVAIRDAEARAASATSAVATTNVAPTVTVSAAPATSERSVTRWPVGAWVMTGVGGASVIAGAVMLGLYSGAVSELQRPENCAPRAGGGFDCEPAAASIRDRASAFGTAGAVALSAGGAMVVGGLVWAFAGRTTERAAVTVSFGFDGLAVAGRF